MARLGGQTVVLPDGWTAAALLAHLAFWDRFAASRLEKYLRDREPMAFLNDAFFEHINAAGLPQWTATGDYSTKWTDIALVSGAIIFDYGPRQNAIYPDKDLGRAAVRAKRAGWFPLGPRGAGRSATASHGAGAEIAGQGGAYRESGATKVLAFVVVNAYGCIVDRSGKIVRGKPTGPLPGRLALRLSSRLRPRISRGPLRSSGMTRTHLRSVAGRRGAAP